MPQIRTENFEPGTAPEWLLTNGIGGYAMGSLSGANIRRYHGLLVAAAAPPVGRVVALHSVSDEIDLGGQIFALATQCFGDEPIVHPEGWRWLEDVLIDMPHEVRWRFRTDELELTRTLRLVAGRNLALVTYEVVGAIPRGAVLRVRPLVTLRDFHSLIRAGDSPPVVALLDETHVRVMRGDSLALDLHVTRGRFTQESEWWRNFAYTFDRERGQEWHEDAFAPGRFEIELNQHSPPVELRAELVLPLVERSAPRPGPRRAAAAGAPRKRLDAAAEQFIVHRRVGNLDAGSIIAGYPWFADWGRDTMISLPGLLLTAGRWEEAGRTLLAYARHIRNGLIPNRFDDYGGGAHYNTVDASLWFIHAVWETLAHHPLAASRDELMDACGAIIRAYSEGTDFNIRLDPSDGLIAAGDEHTQLTWMDAQRDGVTFTPRHGKPIEVNALWHHALHCMAALTDHSEEADRLQRLATRAADSIQRLFWCAKTQCCYDVLAETGSEWIGNESIRPNQIFAASLSPSPFDSARQKSIVNVVREKLLTPFGVRTLDPSHTDYRGRFEGSLFERDAAYHQGTAWPWLIGPYCEATLRAWNFSEPAKREVEKVIEPLMAELDAGSPGTCIGQIAEVYDGEPPHRAAGCPAQAWSVAELVRVLDLLQ